jgi:hypothetical protein
MSPLMSLDLLTIEASIIIIIVTVTVTKSYSVYMHQSIFVDSS